MRVDLTCSCGATLTVGYEVRRTGRYTPDTEKAAADKLLEQFRKDHKLCRVSRAAEGAVT